MIERESPVGKRVSLFVTCMVDIMYPQTGMSVVEVLEYLGVEVDFPQGQTCCAQPAFNAGYWPEARQVARHFMSVFKDAEVIVAPSGSCTAMVRHEYPRLFAGDPLLAAEAERLAGITWEFTEFIVDGLGVTNLNGRLAETNTFAFHEACHGLRVLGLGRQGYLLVENLENATVIPWDNGEICCGFGGLFSVKMADVSGAMLAKKLAQIESSGAGTILTGDVSCLAHMNGGLKRYQSSRRVRHIADVLAESIHGAQRSGAT